MRKIISDFKTLRGSLSELIERSGYKNAYIANQIGMAPSHFYVKKQRGTWNEDEVEKILDVIESDQLEDYFLGKLMLMLTEDDTVSFAAAKEELGWMSK
jgi:predicted transcriptional regulator